jgi:hypothetical protein
MTTAKRPLMIPLDQLQTTEQTWYLSEQARLDADSRRTFYPFARQDHAAYMIEPKHTYADMSIPYKGDRVTMPVPPFKALGGASLPAYLMKKVD